MLGFAKVFGCLSGIYRVVGIGEKITYDTIKDTGIVFYGGLFGLLLAYHLGLRTKMITIKESHAIDVLAVSIPLFHAIARIGCFLAGCCYGIEKECVFSIQYTIMDDDVLSAFQSLWSSF